MILVALAVVVIVALLAFTRKHSAKFNGLALALGDTTVKLEQIYEDPCIRVAHKFLSAEEARGLIAIAEPTLSRSLVSGDGGPDFEDPQRTSLTSFLPSGSDNKLVANIERRASLLLGVPTSNIETFQAVRYSPGDFYSPHFDWFDELREGSNRTATMFIYLNDMDEQETAGHTMFPELDIRVSPELGKALLWRNCEVVGGEVHCSKKSLHGGMAPDKGIKWGLNVWCRSLTVR